MYWFLGTAPLGQMMLFIAILKREINQFLVLVEILK